MHLAALATCACHLKRKQQCALGERFLLTAKQSPPYLDSAVLLTPCVYVAHWLSSLGQFGGIKSWIVAEASSCLCDFGCALWGAVGKCSFQNLNSW